MRRLLRPAPVAIVLLALPGAGHSEEPNPPTSEGESSPAVEDCRSQLERCGVDLEARRDSLIQLNLDLQEIKADWAAARESLEKCARRANAAQVEAERLQCQLDGKYWRLDVKRCEGWDPPQVIVEPYEPE